MDKFIDRQKLEAHFLPAITGKDAYTAGEVLLSIQKFPSADVAPVIHAHWERIGDVAPTGLHGLHYCSLCGYPSMRTFNVSSREALTPYCPNCGAKMDEVET